MTDRTHERLRELPAVQDLLRDESLADLQAAVPRPLVLRAIQDEIAAARARILSSGNGGSGKAAAGKTVPDEAVADDVRARVRARLEREREPGPRRVVNATGVIVHTNLGRAPLAAAAAERVMEVATGYSNLEYDLEKGARGSRHAHVERELAESIGAEAAFAVNNNAAAVMLALAALAYGREVIVSRGELVEIGGSFRVPDILRASGARLVEVGTTNRTHARDYEAAVGPDTALILKVHTSNFRVVGFTAEVPESELRGIAQRAGVPLLWDLGSGTLVDLEGADGGEPTPRRALEFADLVTFSGDKLLGGPQAGIIAGKTGMVERLRGHPLARALRIDKLSLAALATTLRLAMDPARAGEIPVIRMIREPKEAVRERAKALLNEVASLSSRAPEELGLSVIDSEATFGGGAVPGQSIPSSALRVSGSGIRPDALERTLRSGQPPVIARIHDEALFLDLRTVAAGELGTVAAALARAIAG